MSEKFSKEEFYKELLSIIGTSGSPVNPGTISNALTSLEPDIFGSKENCSRTVRDQLKGENEKKPFSVPYQEKFAKWAAKLPYGDFHSFTLGTKKIKLDAKEQHELRKYFYSIFNITPISQTAPNHSMEGAIGQQEIFEITPEAESPQFERVTKNRALELTNESHEAEQLANLSDSVRRQPVAYKQFWEERIGYFSRAEFNNQRGGSSRNFPSENDILANLEEQGQNILLFAGKGGAGKTVLIHDIIKRILNDQTVNLEGAITRPPINAEKLENNERQGYIFIDYLEDLTFAEFRFLRDWLSKSDSRCIIGATRASRYQRVIDQLSNGHIKTHSLDNEIHSYREWVSKSIIEKVLPGRPEFIDQILDESRESLPIIVLICYILTQRGAIDDESPDFPSISENSVFLHFLEKTVSQFNVEELLEACFVLPNSIQNRSDIFKRTIEALEEDGFVYYRPDLGGSYAFLHDTLSEVIASRCLERATSYQRRELAVCIANKLNDANISTAISFSHRFFDRYFRDGEERGVAESVAYEFFDGIALQLRSKDARQKFLFGLLEANSNLNISYENELSVLDMSVELLKGKSLSVEAAALILGCLSDQAHSTSAYQDLEKFLDQECSGVNGYEVIVRAFNSSPRYVFSRAQSVLFNDVVNAQNYKKFYVAKAIIQGPRELALKFLSGGGEAFLRRSIAEWTKYSDCINFVIALSAVVRRDLAEGLDKKANYGRSKLIVDYALNWLDQNQTLSKRGRSYNGVDIRKPLHILFRSLLGIVDDISVLLPFFKQWQSDLVAINDDRRFYRLIGQVLDDVDGQVVLSDSAMAYLISERKLDIYESLRNGKLGYSWVILSSTLNYESLEGFSPEIKNEVFFAFRNCSEAEAFKLLEFSSKVLNKFGDSAVRSEWAKVLWRELSPKIIQDFRGVHQVSSLRHYFSCWYDCLENERLRDDVWKKWLSVSEVNDLEAYKFFLTWDHRSERDEVVPDYVIALFNREFADAWAYGELSDRFLAICRSRSF